MRSEDVLNLFNMPFIPVFCSIFKESALRPILSSSRDVQAWIYIYIYICLSVPFSCQLF